MTSEEVRTLRALCQSMADCIAIEKGWSMVYQFDLKLEAAKDLGIPFARLRHLPYAEWKAIRDPWLAGKGRL